jgi:hypothetical protein
VSIACLGHYGGDIILLLCYTIARSCHTVFYSYRNAQKGYSNLVVALPHSSPS